MIGPPALLAFAGLGRKLSGGTLGSYPGHCGLDRGPIFFGPRGAIWQKANPLWSTLGAGRLFLGADPVGWRPGGSRPILSRHCSAVLAGYPGPPEWDSFQALSLPCGFPGAFLGCSLPGNLGRGHGACQGSGLGHFSISFLAFLGLGSPPPCWFLTLLGTEIISLNPCPGGTTNDLHGQPALKRRRGLVRGILWAFVGCDAGIGEIRVLSHRPLMPRGCCFLPIGGSGDSRERPDLLTNGLRQTIICWGLGAFYYRFMGLTKGSKNRGLNYFNLSFPSARKPARPIVHSAKD